MVAVINVNAYPFLTFLDLTCHLEDKGIGAFWLHCPPVSKEIKLGSSAQETSASAGKNIRVVLVPWKCGLTSISVGVDICEVPRYHCDR